ncbi:MAG: magnesium-protoporphyrin IX monomethyl ester (oxidative) cyclase, partial [Pseudomonadota bacterium]
EISRQCFPIELDLSDAFYADCARLADMNNRMSACGSGIGGKLRRAGLAVRAGAIFAKMYLRPVKRNDLPADVRLEPVW